VHVGYIVVTFLFPLCALFAFVVINFAAICRKVNYQNKPLCFMQTQSPEVTTVLSGM